MAFKSVEEFLNENRVGADPTDGFSPSNNVESVNIKSVGKGLEDNSVPNDDALEGRARAFILKELNVSAKTRHQLARKLDRENIPAAVVARVLDRCEQIRLIDDRQYAADWVKERSELKHLGRRALTQELAKKGVAQQYIEQALEYYDIDDGQLAQQLVRKKMRNMAKGMSFKEKEKHKRRLFSLLARKGIPGDTAMSVINQVMKSLDQE